VALALHTSSGFRIKTLALDGVDLAGDPAFGVEGEVTCLALGKLAGRMVVLAGIWKSERPFLMIHPAECSPESPLLSPITLDVLKSKLSLGVS
jgi:hypothetical protein